MSLYNLRSTELSSYRVTKFDSDLNVESSYNVIPSTCDCPQGHKITCRHRKMLKNILPIVDTEWFYDYDVGHYQTILGDYQASPPPLAAPAGPSIVGSPALAPLSSSLRRRV